MTDYNGFDIILGSGGWGECDHSEVIHIFSCGDGGMEGHGCGGGGGGGDTIRGKRECYDSLSIKISF